MVSPSTSTVSTTLPGPVTSPGAQVPRPSSPPIPLQIINPSSTVTSGTTSTGVKDPKFAFPWKYEGYKEFSKWMASEDDFFIFRRFQTLNARTILWLQHRISNIEQQLNEHDLHVENSRPENNLKNSSFAFDKTYVQARDMLMQELSVHLHQYSVLITLQFSLLSLFHA
jgi:hypothetical protein